MNRKQTDKECLDLWKKAIKLRDKICQRPNCPHCFNQPDTKYLQAHHIIPRTCYSLRHDIKNGILLCRASHGFWAENTDPLTQKEVIKFYDKFVDMQYLESKRYQQTKLEYEAIKIYLKKEIEKLLNMS